ncbi:MAG: OmpA family protein [Sulfurimonas sp.]|jgi:outer membrane protein OmpA-like peptidoglycan-associated protein
MKLKISILASTILVVALNAGWNIPPSVAEELDKSAALSSTETTETPIEEGNATIGVVKVDAEQKAAAKKVEAAATKKAKEEVTQKAEVAAAARNAAEVEAAKKSLVVAPKDWETSNTTVGIDTNGSRTEDANYKKEINESEFKRILPIAVEEADHDHDGIPSSIDKCPATPLGKKVDASGCCIDGDDDYDGVANSMDKCPTTPKGRAVNGDGCEPDSDNDGVLDIDDKCPDTPKLFKVNSVGCPQTAILKVNFETNTYDIKDNYSEDIKKFAQFLKDNSGYNAIVSGHTDAIGSSESNMVLSQNRADTVMKSLIQEGIEAGRLSSIGEGENRPVADNLLKDGRMENRRIEVELKSTATK